MALTELALPVDLPWKRMAVSSDMIDTTPVGDLQFPPKWRSSVAVFYHEPTELPPEYCNRRITYLKIIATLANYQIAGPDVSVLEELREAYGDFYAWRSFDSRVTNSYPCYGALLQVAVHPHGADVEAHDYPYITALQPRKREMYEVVTESGEVASQSANKLNVLKGTTSTDTTEDYDLDLGGGGWSAAFGLASSNAGQKQEGTIERRQLQDQDVTTTDSSREKREAYAYSTSLNQLYTLLQAYHLGTNRAIFFLQPRPHIQDSQFTFIQGLRRLEGIQEFLIIIDRPAAVPGVCVEIALETAHLYAWRAYRPRLVPASELRVPGNLAKTAGALGLNTNDYPTYRDLVSTWNTFYPWARQLAVREQQRAAPPWPLWELVTRGIISANAWARLVSVVGDLPDIGMEDIALLFDEYEAQSGTVFVTGRKLCACVTPVHEETEDSDVECEESSQDNISTCTAFPSIVYWKGFAVAVSDYLHQPTQSLAQNALVQQLNDALSSSLGAQGRFAYDQLDFLSTDFILDDLAQVIRLLGRAGVSDLSLEDVPELDDLIKAGLGSKSDVETVIQLGSASTAQLARDLGVTESEARMARRDALVASMRALDPKTMRADPDRVNTLGEEFGHLFPADQLRRLELSSRVYLGEPEQGALRYGRGLFGRLFRYLVG